MSNETLVSQLATWVLSIKSSEIPPEVMTQAKLLMLDSLGCAIAAQNENAFTAGLAAIREVGGKPDCMVIGTRERTSLPNAVLLNGILIRALDLNDLYVGPRQNGHPSDNLAVAFSFAEWQASSGEELLTAMVVGYELYGRLQDLSDPNSPWDHVTVSSLVAPAIAGRLLKWNTGQLANAMALSAAHGNTLAAVRFGQLSSAKNLANAAVAYNATIATLLAKHGLTGPLGVLEGPRGLGQAVFSNADLSALVQPFAVPLRLMNVSIKAYPCIGTAQTAVAAALQARRRIQDASKIESITLRMANIPFVKHQLQDAERRYPRTRETADHSFYYLVAAALLDGDVSVEGFKKERWTEAAVTALMERMTIVADDRLNLHTPGTFPCVLEYTTQTGEAGTVEVIHAPGSAKNRMSKAQVEEKFHNSCGVILKAGERDKIIEQVENLERLDSVTSLMSSLQS
ncbi:MAG: MmgE/PrpD family protein [Candidatus Binatia bacterium]